MMGKEPCSNCGQISCNGIDCYYKDDPEPQLAMEMIIFERLRQQTQEGYTLAHDDEHSEGQLALLAAAYALSNRAPTT